MIKATDEYIARQRARAIQLRDNGVQVPLPVSDRQINRRVRQLNEQSYASRNRTAAEG